MQWRLFSVLKCCANCGCLLDDVPTKEEPRAAWRRLPAGHALVRVRPQQVAQRRVVRKLAPTLQLADLCASRERGVWGETDGNGTGSRKGHGAQVCVHTVSQHANTQARTSQHCTDNNAPPISTIVVQTETSASVTLLRYHHSKAAVTAKEEGGCGDLWACRGNALRNTAAPHHQPPALWRTQQPQSMQEMHPCHAHARHKLAPHPLTVHTSSIVRTSGESPPWTQKMFPSMTAQRLERASEHKETNDVWQQAMQHHNDDNTYPKKSVSDKHDAKIVSR